MELRQVEGKDMREALERTRDSLGEKAVVVSHRRAADGRVVLAVSDEVPRSVQALAALRAEARAALAARKGRAGGRAALAATGLADVERRMRRSGCSPELVASVVRESETRLEEGRHPLDVAADVIGETFRIARAKATPGTTPVMAFLGPTGVGKTTSAAKLARRMVRAGRKVALVSLQRGKSADRLRTLAGVLDVPYAGLDAAGAGLPAIAAGVDAVLLDTSGDVQRDVDRLGALAAAAAFGGGSAARRALRIDPYLVLSATSNRAVLEELHRVAAPLEPVGCVVTKLDEIPLRAPILEFAREHDLPIAFLADGASFHGRFHRASSERFADLCLRGRLS